MDRVFLVLNGWSLTGLHLVFAGLGLTVLLLLVLIVQLARGQSAHSLARMMNDEREHERDEKMTDIARQSSELKGRIHAFAEVLGSRQSDLARVVSDRLEASRHSTSDQLGQLQERLAVIDAAQTRLTSLTREVVGLKDILANKQARGAFGQGRMEAIIRDALPPSSYDFQFTLSNRTRPDCVLRLPGDDRLLAVDAKFPLEGFTAFKEARDDDARKAASARVRQDFSRHIKDIAERYLLPGETQDLAILFVPSESLFADLNEFFDDLVQRAHRARIIICSPSLLMMAIQVMQSLVRDARVREQAHEIQAEVRLLVDDVRRLSERAAKLDAHFRAAQDDLSGLLTSAAKVERRTTRIEQMDFPAEAQAAPLKAAE